ncbi:expressed unknown protein [Ectocarpus siliculosus]|uniref:Uncharacterized protein n=1 Tax=Ectocarpus siliculosus TaxID=2880 RepID=D7FKC3_ECTSI|nr:expressed unknown protein [Ectocarpus siliculosus]|eukprot:CBJ29326.1 expressed unknown protein [Ectocarpus siliculosus]
MASSRRGRASACLPWGWLRVRVEDLTHSKATTVNSSEAEQWYKTMLDYVKSSLGSGHLVAATTVLHNQARFLESQERYAESASLYVESHAIRVKVPN